ncbi:hypothetical protein [Streptomyces anulatus]|uniref:hypothetical protein n=1 Tax=Streptomyces anulatus TaxID=1892 RepID=UPI0004C73492|nr:hypothetical protein [Streptomyces anulatus]
MAGSTDRRSYDTGASTEVQAALQVVIGRLEQVITARDTLRWNATSQEVRNIIRLLRTTLEKNDGTATQTLARAKAAVDGIG